MGLNCSIFRVSVGFGGICGFVLITIEQQEFPLFSIEQNIFGKISFVSGSEFQIGSYSFFSPLCLIRLMHIN